MQTTGEYTIHHVNGLSTNCFSSHHFSDLVLCHNCFPESLIVAAEPAALVPLSLLYRKHALLLKHNLEQRQRTHEWERTIKAREGNNGGGKGWKEGVKKRRSVNVG